MKGKLAPPTPLTAENSTTMNSQLPKNVLDFWPNSHWPNFEARKSDGDLSPHEIAGLNGVERASTGGYIVTPATMSASNVRRILRVNLPVHGARKTTASLLTRSSPQLQPISKKRKSHLPAR